MDVNSFRPIGSGKDKILLFDHNTCVATLHRQEMLGKGRYGKVYRYEGIHTPTNTRVEFAVKQKKMCRRHQCTDKMCIDTKYPSESLQFYASIRSARTLRAEGFPMVPSNIIANTRIYSSTPMEIMQLATGTAADFLTMDAVSPHARLSVASVVTDTICKLWLRGFT